MVIAETMAQAKEGAERLDVHYEVLPAVADVVSALATTTAPIHDDAPGNLCYEWEIVDSAATAQAFTAAAHVVEIEIVNNRLILNAIEPRAAIGDYDPANGSYTLYTTSQNPHVIRLLMGAFVLQIPEHKLRVVAPDVGGGFGSKIYHYAEEAIVAWAAGRLRRPVKWTAERSESFLSDAHGRDHVTKARLALDGEGVFLGLEVHTAANLGAYLSTFGGAIPTYLYATLLAGVYRTPAIHCIVTAGFTNTVPVDAYRGAGRPEAAYILERLVDRAARQLGMAQNALRRCNFIPPEAFPYQTPVALEYDSVDYVATLERAQALADVAGFPACRVEAERRGKRRGLGYSTYLEACGIAPSAIAGALGGAGLALRMRQCPRPSHGSMTVYTGSHSHGQGHETTFAQLVAETMGLLLEAIDVRHGDTAEITFGMGTYGSRSLAVGSEALMKALHKVVAKATQTAAHAMEADAADIAFRDGAFVVAGTGRKIRKMSFAEVALVAYVPHNFPHDRLEPGLEEQAFYDPKNFTFPGGCHICEMEVDSETGVVEVVTMTAVDDFGRVINQMIVEGQVQGGLAQGLGQALLESCRYDRDGQPLIGSYMDYAMPRADTLPSFRTDTTSTLCRHNTLGAKGCGEAGAIGSPPAVINAVVDALWDLGVRDIAMPATPQTVWRALRAARPVGVAA